MRNKKFSSIVAIFAAAIAVFSAANFARAADSCNDHVVISQIYGGGGNKDALYRNDFIELYNPTDKDISLENWSVQYVPATKNFPASSSASSIGSTLLHKNIKAKTYYLIQEKSNSDEGKTLDTPDAIGLINLAADKGKIALVSNTTLIASEDDPLIKDLVIYSGGSNTKSIFHKINSCPSTFLAEDPNPRNSSFIEASDEDESTSDDTTDEPEEETSNNATNELTRCAASSENIKLNELFPYPETGGQEFVELKNFGKVCVDLSGWKIEDEGKHKYTFPSGTTVEPEKFLLTARNFYMNNTAAETMYLLDSSGKEIDKVSYAKALNDSSFSFDGKEFLWSSTSTPGAENVFDAPEDEDMNNSDAVSANVNATASEKVYLNEILPNPKGDEEKDEFIEIVNGESGSIDLFGWTIRDGSKSGKYVFKEHTEIVSGEYLAIYRSQFKIALNNSAESVSLYNPQGELTSSVSYDKSLENASYSFDGKIWKWSKYLTPNKKNKFDSEPSVKITKPKHAYKDLVTEFSAKAKDKETKNLKYSWDFGDGQKSYLAKTSHKYLDTGRYTVTLSVSDDSQTVEKSFTLEVKKYPRPDLELVKIVPNPAGNDSEGEIVEIKNNSSKKIGLTGWKIATGSGEKIYNHLISEELILNSNEAKTITREFSKFSLNNKAGKVQLVMPDGKVIDEVEYSKEKIAEDEAYMKIDGEWKWITPSAQDENADESDTTEDDLAAPNQSDDENTDNGEILGAEDENISVSPSYDSSFTSEDAYIFLSRINFMKNKQEMNYTPASNPSSTIAYLIASLI